MLASCSKKDHEPSPIESIKYGTGKLLVCGSNKVYILNLKTSTPQKQDIEWEWIADNATDIPPKYKSTYFKTMDECKQSNDGKKIFVTSSSGGVGVINKTDKKVLFYAYVPQAHSIEELPNGLIAVISSTHNLGNSIDLFDINKSEQSLFRLSFTSGHGLVWHRSKKLLYAFGGKDLRTYKLEGDHTNSPILTLEDRWSQPGSAGHDMQISPDSSTLILTDTKNVWSFNLSKQFFSSYLPLANKQNVKSISIHRTDERILFQVPEESYWSFHINILQPSLKIPIPDMKVYKARWWYD